LTIVQQQQNNLLYIQQKINLLLARFHTVFKHYNLNCRHLITAIDNAISAARFLSLGTEFPNPAGFQIVRVVMLIKNGATTYYYYIDILRRFLRTKQQHIILIYCVVH
jgi:hypothetical protein